MKFILAIFMFFWELPQLILGLLLFVILAPFSQYLFKYKGVYVYKFRWFNFGSLQLGSFMFLASHSLSGEATFFADLVSHEYGHKIQSKLIGPWLMIAVILPSFIHACIYSLFRLHKYYNYYSVLWESTASDLGQSSGIFKVAHAFALGSETNPYR